MLDTGWHGAAQKIRVDPHNRQFATIGARATTDRTARSSPGRMAGWPTSRSRCGRASRSTRAPPPRSAAPVIHDSLSGSIIPVLNSGTSNPTRDLAFDWRRNQPGSRGGWRNWNPGRLALTCRRRRLPDPADAGKLQGPARRVIELSRRFEAGIAVNPLQPGQQHAIASDQSGVVWHYGDAFAAISRRKRYPGDVLVEVGGVWIDRVAQTVSANIDRRE